jgi:hypothetical protein
MQHNHDHAQTKAEQRPLTGVEQLEHSIADCEELLASVQTAKHPSAGRTKYLLTVRLVNIRQQLEDMAAGETGQ